MTEKIANAVEDIADKYSKENVVREPELSLSSNGGDKGAANTSLILQKLSISEFNSKLNVGGHHCLVL